MRDRSIPARAGALLLTAMLCAGASAQAFVNGDFEQNTYSGCGYNQTNTAFSMGMTGCVGYGPGGSTSQMGEIDVMDGSCAQYGPVGPVGTTRLGLAANNATQGNDALTLELTAPLVVGQSYTVSFFGHSVLGSGAVGPGQVEIGTSPTAGAQGTVVGTSAPFDTSRFEPYSVTFTATSPDLHISVSAVLLAYRTWNWVDGFTIQPAQAAWCAMANGNGSNPEACTCFLPPVLGGAWIVDVAPEPSTLFTVVYLALEHLAPLTLPYGELLIEPPVVSIAGSLTHVAPIPSSTQLLGEVLWAQGLRVDVVPTGLDLVLTNALCGGIGY